MSNTRKVIWLDFETTGLDPNRCGILETSAWVVDRELKILSKVHRVNCAQKVPGSYDNALSTETMDEWCRKTHTTSGLLAEVEKAVISIEGVEIEILSMIEQHFGPKEKPLLAGNSIHFDRSFIRVHMPNLDKRLHYRMVDVSAITETLKFYYGHEIPKREVRHRTENDCEDSIDLFRRALRWMDDRPRDINRCGHGVTMTDHCYSCDADKEPAVEGHPV